MLRNKVEKNYLLRYEEAYIVATSEIDGSYEIPRYVHTFTEKLQKMLHDVGGKIIDNVIKPASSQRYSCRLIQPENINEERSEGHK